MIVSTAEGHEMYGMQVFSGSTRPHMCQRSTQQDRSKLLRLSNELKIAHELNYFYENNYAEVGANCKEMGVVVWLPRYSLSEAVGRTV